MATTLYGTSDGAPVIYTYDRVHDEDHHEVVSDDDYYATEDEVHDAIIQSLREDLEEYDPDYDLSAVTKEAFPIVRVPSFAYINHPTDDITYYITKRTLAKKF